MAYPKRDNFYFYVGNCWKTISFLSHFWPIFCGQFFCECGSWQEILIPIKFNSFIWNLSLILLKSNHQSWYYGYINFWWGWCVRVRSYSLWGGGCVTVWTLTCVDFMEIHVNVNIWIEFMFVSYRILVSQHAQVEEAS